MITLEKQHYAIWPPDTNFSLGQDLPDVSGRIEEAKRWFLENGFSATRMMSTLCETSTGRTVGYRAVSAEDLAASDKKWRDFFTWIDGSSDEACPIELTRNTIHSIAKLGLVKFRQYMEPPMEPQA
jgi:hypothetical protein